jgi:hypothetical protein
MADDIEQPDEAEVDAPEEEALPTHKDELVALAIARKVPSYEAWAMTVPELTAKLKES